VSVGSLDTWPSRLSRRGRKERGEGRGEERERKRENGMAVSVSAKSQMLCVSAKILYPIKKKKKKKGKKRGRKKGRRVSDSRPPPP